MINKQRDKEIIDLYQNSKLTVKEIAKQFSISTIRVFQITKKFRPKERKGKLVKGNPFKDLSNPEVQYWLGYLASDGCVHGNRISLTQKEEDKEIIYKFQKFLGGEVNVKRFFHKKYGKEYPQFCISFRSNEIMNWLDSLGITQRKTETLKVNFKFDFNFLRGFIDGDGSYSIKSKTNRNRIRIACKSIDFINQISEFLNLNNITHAVYKQYKEEKFLYDLHIYKIVDMWNCIELLYKNASVFNERKHYNAAQIRNNLMKTPEIQEISVRNPEASQQLIGE